MRNFAAISATLALACIILLAGCSARPEPRSDASADTTGDELRNSYGDPLLIQYAADHPKVAPHAGKVAAASAAAASATDEAEAATADAPADAAPDAPAGEAEAPVAVPAAAEAGAGDAAAGDGEE